MNSLSSLYGYSAEWIANSTGVTIRTAQKYASGGKIPEPTRRLLHLKATRKELGSDWKGWVIHGDTLYSPEGLKYSPGYLRSMQYLYDLHLSVDVYNEIRGQVGDWVRNQLDARKDIDVWSSAAKLPTEHMSRYLIDKLGPMLFTKSEAISMIGKQITIGENHIGVATGEIGIVESKKYLDIRDKITRGFALVIKFPNSENPDNRFTMVKWEFKDVCKPYLKSITQTAQR